jgi:hypothetical protein
MCGYSWAGRRDVGQAYATNLATGPGSVRPTRTPFEAAVQPHGCRCGRRWR